MSNSMMRVSKELVDDIKTLKKVKSVKGSLSDLVHTLVKQELRKTHAYTKDGYLPEGSVVKGIEGKPVVIKTVIQDKVVFNDSTYLINGGTACFNLGLLATTIDKFDGGFCGE